MPTSVTYRLDSEWGFRMTGLTAIHGAAHWHECRGDSVTVTHSFSNEKTPRRRLGRESVAIFRQSRRDRPTRTVQKYHCGKRVIHSLLVEGSPPPGTCPRGESRRGKWEWEGTGEWESRGGRTRKSRKSAARMDSPARREAPDPSCGSHESTEGRERTSPSLIPRLVDHDMDEAMGPPGQSAQRS
jgi:hypothetical protein